MQATYVSGNSSSLNSEANWKSEAVIIKPLNRRGNKAATNSNEYGADNSYVYGGAGFNGECKGNYYDNTAFWPDPNYYGNDVNYFVYH